MKMRAAVLFHSGSPLVIEDALEIPKLRAGQVLVQLAYSGVCHSQLMEARGKRGIDRYLPHLLGHEGSGRVVDIGESVSKVKAGDRVVLGWIKGSGAEVHGTQYRKGEQIFNAGAVTTFNEYAVVSESRCVRLPDNIPLDVAVLFGCAVPTGAGILVNMVQERPNQSIAVYGLGGIGLSALMATALYSFEKIIAIDIEDEKLALARQLGATHTINCKDIDVVNAILQLTQGKGVDYCIEAAGQTKTIEQAFSSVRDNGGHCIFASHPPHGEKIHLDPHALIRGKRIEGTWGGACDPDRDLPRFFDLHAQGKLPVEKLLSKRYRLDDVNEALSDLEQRKITRALLEIDTSLEKTQ